MDIKKSDEILIKSFPEEIKNVSYIFPKGSLEEEWREEALRHRKQLSEALKLINQLENRYKDKRIYVSRKYLKKIKSVLGSDKE